MCRSNRSSICFRQKIDAMATTEKVVRMGSSLCHRMSRRTFHVTVADVVSARSPDRVVAFP